MGYVFSLRGNVLPSRTNWPSMRAASSSDPSHHWNLRGAASCALPSPPHCSRGVDIETLLQIFRYASGRLLGWNGTAHQFKLQIHTEEKILRQGRSKRKLSATLLYCPITLRFCAPSKPPPVKQQRFDADGWKRAPNFISGIPPRGVMFTGRRAGDMARCVAYGLGRCSLTVCHICHKCLCGLSQVKYRYLCQ